MALISKKVVEPAVPEKIVEKNTGTICDICGVVTTHSTWSGDETDWSGSAWDHERVSVRTVIGTAYPECGWEEITWFDICPKCFAEKLIPWLQSQGAEPYTTKVDW